MYTMEIYRFCMYVLLLRINKVERENAKTTYVRTVYTGV